MNPDAINDAKTIPNAGKPLAVVVKMGMLTRPDRSGIKSQVEAAFPGVPVIFVDQGTEIEVIHAAE